jgi:hypothetical protein
MKLSNIGFIFNLFKLFREHEDRAVMTSEEAKVEDQIFVLDAQRAGLERAAAQYPSDVAIAMATARQVRDAFEALGQTSAAPGSGASFEDPA